PVKKGEHLSLEVSSKSRTKPPNITLKPIEIIAKKSINTPQVQMPMVKALSQNQQFHAKVEQRLPSGNITFSWQGTSFESEAPQHVQIGDFLNLKVEKTGKKPRLAVLDVVKNLPEKSVSLFRNSIAKSAPMGKVLQTLLQLNPPSTTSPTPNTLGLGALTTLLETYSITSDKPLDGSRFASMVRESGLLHEASLGKYLQNPAALIKHVHQLNLKTALLHIAEEAQASKQSSHQSTAITQTAEQGINRIESQQALNLLALQNEPLRIEIPMIVHNQVSTVQIAIAAQSDDSEKAQETPNASDSFNILFSLDLSNIGNIRIDARITTQSVHATLYSENDETRHFIQRNISRLTERLEATGFKDIQLSITSQKQLTAKKEEHFNRLEAGLPISRGLLDVTG
ncbi:MAG: flagellar hook-length control protein FliK, partial [Mariprofundaceae bacterium]